MIEPSGWVCTDPTRIPLDAWRAFLAYRHRERDVYEVAAERLRDGAGVLIPARLAFGLDP